MEINSNFLWITFTASLFFLYTDATSVLVCQNANDLNISCSDDQLILVVNVFFGRTSSEICIDHSGDYQKVDCVDSNTYGELAEICFGQSNCNIRGGEFTYIFGNPCPGVPKYLSLEYECVPRSALISIAAYHEQRLQVSLMPHIGAITSGNYPNQYLGNSYNRLEITGLPGQMITFTILDVALEVSSVYGCVDLLVLRPVGNAEALTLCLNPEYKTSVNTTFTLEDDVAIISFESGASYQGRGFLIGYKVSQSFSLDCSGTGIPQAPENGLIKEVSGLTVTYGCLKGYAMLPPGDVTKRCEGSGWSGDLGTCVNDQEINSTTLTTRSTTSTTEKTTTIMSTSTSKSTPTKTSTAPTTSTTMTSKSSSISETSLSTTTESMSVVSTITLPVSSPSTTTKSTPPSTSTSSSTNPPTSTTTEPSSTTLISTTPTTSTTTSIEPSSATSINTTPSTSVVLETTSPTTTTKDESSLPSTASSTVSTISSSSISTSKQSTSSSSTIQTTLSTSTKMPEIISSTQYISNVSITDATTLDGKFDTTILPEDSTTSVIMVKTTLEALPASNLVDLNIFGIAGIAVACFVVLVVIVIVILVRIKIHKRKTREQRQRLASLRPSSHACVSIPNTYGGVGFAKKNAGSMRTSSRSSTSSTSSKSASIDTDLYQMPNDIEQDTPVFVVGECSDAYSIESYETGSDANLVNNEYQRPYLETIHEEHPPHYLPPPPPMPPEEEEDISRRPSNVSVPSSNARPHSLRSKVNEPRATVDYPLFKSDQTGNLLNYLDDRRVSV